MWQEWPAHKTRRGRQRQTKGTMARPHQPTAAGIDTVVQSDPSWLQRRASRASKGGYSPAVTVGWVRGGDSTVRKEEEQQYSHCGQKAKEDHCMTPKQLSLTAQCRECLRKA